MKSHCILHMPLLPLFHILITNCSCISFYLKLKFGPRARICEGGGCIYGHDLGRRAYKPLLWASRIVPPTIRPFSEAPSPYCSIQILQYKYKYFNTNINTNTSLKTLGSLPFSEAPYQLLYYSDAQHVYFVYIECIVYIVPHTIQYCSDVHQQQCITYCW